MAFNNLSLNYYPPYCSAPSYPMCLPGDCYAAGYAPPQYFSRIIPPWCVSCDPCAPKVFNPCAHLQKCKSAEIIGGEVIIGCECEKFNGLQGDCKRSECRGQYPCYHRPAACRPSIFSNGKHLGTKYFRNGSLPYCRSPGPIPLCTTY
ncbi:hypothetical protein HHI36_007413 [Cryptolaemus montrouzieri]|uniref:Uncharacterized protein n=1 Tax=Cryptolaemus montrouzieri TaxID=559131 RepID=A0ABD2MPV6_9CUCU